MTTTPKDKTQEPAKLPEDSGTDRNDSEPDGTERDRPAPEEARQELTEAQRAERSRQYVKLRMAATPGDAEEAREKIRAIDGPDAEIGDHVLVLADGRQFRTEYAGATMHDGLPVISTYTSIQ